MKKTLGLMFAIALAACSSDTETEISAETDARVAAIHERFVFADMHAHPSRFHRANVETIAAEEIDRYRSGYIDIVTANISSDMAYSGGYFDRDGSEVERGQYKPEAGKPFALAFDRLMRLNATIESGVAVHADGPDAVLAAREAGEVALLPALEGADALEGDIGNFHEMVDKGLRLIQIVHFRANELGHIQTYPYSPGGLTEFGREVIAAANQRRIIIDLAHANTETIMDVLALSTKPVIFSHGGVKALKDQDRALSDEEIRAISAKGGVVGIWPNGNHIAHVARMVDFIEHVIEIGGEDHVGIGSDLRGMGKYSAGFGREANFRAIAQELLARGHTDETVGKIMGGNFFRVWQTVAETG